MNGPIANPLPPYHHSPLFPLGPDKTKYRKIASEGREGQNEDRYRVKFFSTEM